MGVIRICRTPESVEKSPRNTELMQFCDAMIEFFISIVFEFSWKWYKKKGIFRKFTDWRNCLRISKPKGRFFLVFQLESCFLEAWNQRNSGFLFILMTLILWLTVYLRSFHYVTITIAVRVLLGLSISIVHKGFSKYFL